MSASIMTKRTTGVQVYCADLAQDHAGACGMRRCERTEQDAHHDKTTWTTIQGRILVGRDAAAVPMDWTEVCHEHRDQGVTAVTAVVTTYGQAWRVDAMTDDYAAEQFRPAEVVRQS